MRWSVSREIEFDAGHRVPNHKSKCANAHGHRYRMRVTWEGPVVTTTGTSDEGMVVDFGDLKAWLTTYVHDVYDHAFIAYEGDGELIKALVDTGNRVVVVPFIPTAENLATDSMRLLANVTRTNAPLVVVARVELWETPTGRVEVVA